jgi:hypothetical protein
MRWLLTPVLLLSAMTASAQSLVSQLPAPAISSSSSTADTLPDAPGEAPSETPDTIPPHQASVVAVAEASFAANNDGAKTCNVFRAMKVVYVNPNRYDEVRKPCGELIYPYQRFLTTEVVIPMTWQQKGYLALHNLTDPANFGTILGISAITIGTDSHSAYGPGLKGFGKIVGVSLLEDATGQFFGTFAVPALVHQDPRYFRMPHAKLSKRIVYSISRTFISRHDDGTSMPNYATLFTYPIGAVLANQYVPGIASDASSTIVRIITGYATDPANNLLNEFLPDVAAHVQVRIIFVQRILNNIASGANGVTLQ